MVKPTIFVVATIILVYISRESLRRPRAHGFYRFIAWESILALVLINADRWFRKPFALLQLVSWLLLAISLLLVIYGVYSLRVIGKPDAARRDEAHLMGIEKTTALVSVGAYRYIRHPLYSSMLFGAWGAFFKHPSWPAVLLAGTATLFTVITARVEEAECIRYFGPPYQAYMKRTRMFVPFLF